MAWMHLEDSTYDHYKFDDLAESLGMEPVHAMGHVVSLWTWALRHRPDGDLDGLDHRVISRAAKYKGSPRDFVEGCVNAKLIDPDLKIHNFLSRAGSYKNAKRVADWRAKKKAKNVQHSNSTVMKCNIERRGDRGEETEETDKPPATLADAVSPKNGEEISLVWGHWRTHHPRAAQNLDKGMKGYKLIAARLKEGKSVEDLKQAIDGFHLDSWVGRKNFLQLKYLFGDDDLVTKFIGYAVNPPSLLSDKTQRTVAAAQQWLASKGEK